MAKKHVLFLCLLLVFFCGCSFFSSKELVSVGDRIVYVDSGKVIKPKELSRGGGLLVVPFNAGVDVAATDETEKVALGIVKGIYDIIGSGKSSFKVLNADNAEKAKVLLKGHITQMVVPKQGLFSWFSLGEKKKILAVEGKMVEKDSGEIILVFSHSKETTKKNESIIDLGVNLGQDVGRLMLSEK